jgi:ComEC/Rec2-related protein
VDSSVNSSSPRRPALFVALAGLIGVLLAAPASLLWSHLLGSPLLGSPLLGFQWAGDPLHLRTLAGLSGFALAIGAGARRSTFLALLAVGASLFLLAIPAPTPAVPRGVVKLTVEVAESEGSRPGGRYGVVGESGSWRVAVSGRCPAPRVGETITITGYLRPPTRWQAGRGVSAQVEAARIESRQPGHGLRALRGAVRTALSRAIREGAPQQHRLLGSVLLGSGQVRAPERAAFSATGCAHLLSISGLHVAILAGLALLLLRALGWSPLAQRFGVAALLLAYVFLVGPRAPTIRATVASLAWLLAPGRSDGFNRLSCALVVVLAWDPGAPRSLGFQLSFGTVAGLILLGRIWRPRLWLARQFAGGVTAFVASTPLLAARLGQVPWVALWLGLPALGLFSLILGLALVGAILAVLDPTLGAPALTVADGLASLLVWAIEACASAFPPDRLLPPSALVVTLGLGALAWGSARREGGRSSAVLFLIGGALCLGWTLPPPRGGNVDAGGIRVVAHSRGALVEDEGGLVSLGELPRGGELRSARSLTRQRRLSGWTPVPLASGSARLFEGRGWRILWVPRSGRVELSEPVDLIVTNSADPARLRRLRRLLRPGASKRALVRCPSPGGLSRPIVVHGPGG